MMHPSGQRRGTTLYQLLCSGAIPPDAVATLAPESRPHVSSLSFRRRNPSSANSTTTTTTTTASSSAIDGGDNDGGVVATCSVWSKSLPRDAAMPCTAQALRDSMSRMAFGVVLAHGGYFAAATCGPAGEASGSAHRATHCAVSHNGEYDRGKFVRAASSNLDRGGALGAALAACSVVLVHLPGKNAALRPKWLVDTSTCLVIGVPFAPKGRPCFEEAVAVLRKFLCPIDAKHL
ncbi:hypothetical protein Pelo_7121 [Pelomyxa schiedti]|nr:hypothetical protein Pelo_7121 [Pelomyxa schiedti]